MFMDKRYLYWALLSSFCGLFAHGFLMLFFIYFVCFKAIFYEKEEI